MKSFLEVFPDLHIADNVRELFELVKVEKVATTRDRSSIRIYIDSPRLIHKQNIYKLEEGIKSQLFPGKAVTIKILEKYHLSGQYTPRKLMDVYRDSILMELKNYSILLYNMFRKAELAFDEKDLLTMELEDTMITKDKAPELVRILEKIFTERCNIPMEVKLTYRPAQVRKRDEDGPAVIYMNQDGAQAPYGGVSEPQMQGDSLAPAADLPFDEGSTVLKPVGDLNFQVEKKQKASPEAGGRAAQGKQGGDQNGKKGKGDFGGRDGKKEYRRSGYGKKSDNPDVLYGRDFDEESTEIEKIEGEIGEVVIRGKILATDVRELRSGNSLFIFSISDFTDTISVKVFAREDSLEDLKNATKAGQFVRLKGVANIDRFDGELTIGSVVGIKKCEDFTTKRVDNAPVKRVELHCHTKMSDMDGVSEVKDLIKRAKQWGMDAMAVTDHGCAQAFPDANHSVEKGDNFKVLYGVEGYLVDDMKDLVENGAGQTLDHTCVVFDIETTGFSPVKNKIIEIGAVRVEEGKIVNRFSSFVNPDVPIPFEIEKLTGINDNMVLDAPKIEKVLPEFLKFCEGAVMVAHNAGFDISFIKENARQQGLEFNPTVLDTVSLARVLLPNLNRFKLDTVAKELKISLANHHRAVDDAGATAEIFVRFIKMLKERDIFDLTQLNALSKMTVEMIRKMPTYHIILLAKNDIGRINLYRLVSESNLTYFARRPRIPKSLLTQYREGLIIGSACEAGELYQALLRGVPDTEIHKIVDFYDYLEIQPLGNNAFMLRDEKSPVSSEEDLKDINRKIVDLGVQFNKPVCATCDVHFLDPEDEVYRRIIMSSKGFKDADDQAPLYLRTTEEMLKEFEYLGSDKAEEVVITNTRKIAAMCERIEPVRPDKCAPVIPNSDETLRNICYNRAHEMYGEDLPQIVVARLERELNSIISNGFAVMYIIAQKLVWKSNEDGYLVGSRGSVGSSLVATMSGITEVNPLSPHYYCTKCHFYDFDSAEVKKFSGMAGCDMPDRKCPVCGEPLTKDGFDIPFETFLGFKGDKEPDIDLNFSGEYQSRAHTYTEVIFGKGQTFRAGTIGTLADKTAYGYVKGYYEDRGQRKRRCEIDRIVGGCVGVRRTTGQHPGGIIVLPHGEEIYSFTPVQHPADDMTTKTVTTHFDYHSIDHNLLKLDILGHDDPTMIRMLQDLTGKDPLTDFPLDSKEVMSLFQNTSALGIEPEDIGGCKLGALGIPEFGTDFAMQMLIDAQPKYFSDLVRISGLSHGTDVWLGNAQTLIQEGKATIQTAICTRDDIMVYLISMGLEEGLAFTIMESVRKGKGLKDEWIKEMTDHGVPDWYIWSCKKIKYMFPKAHAAAYVMMAWRIAYCKVFYPLAYYAAFFSIRASGFSYVLMCQGREKLEYHLADYKKRADTLSKKEQDTLRDMRIVQEMYARGFEFTPIDIFKASARSFQIVDGKLMPSLSSIDGLGEKAADAIVFAAEDGPFLSKEDFINRTKVTKTVCDLMGELGLLGSLPESNQLSLFDMVM
ncbi:PolC-type DNA polymerase III [[Clostridium] symbiosum]|uniref:PolC-type DNA polymerase III n=1 Tax=Clostridium symbiosum TaxID=1512 RepID=UPI001D0645A2|nr:PolC-type DNA polymerase III [[Clostridium] symbiosum]MCB6607426.1 PolC-type DNA polymerase III [[Clostridium] symbiosum]MCB6930018.1 PolC-type DNA polymerase III [[Clostridium] symbiosum]